MFQDFNYKNQTYIIKTVIDPADSNDFKISFKSMISINSFINDIIKDSTVQSRIISIIDKITPKDCRPWKHSQAPSNQEKIEKLKHNLFIGHWRLVKKQNKIKKNLKDLFISLKGINFLKSYEGLELKLYNDAAGYATIGYGHLVHYGKVGTNKSKEQPFDKGISIAEAEKLLRDDIRDKSEQYVKKLVKVELTQEQYDALVIFTFNLGPTNFNESMLLKEVNNEQTDENIIESRFLSWVSADGKRLNGLVKRRKKEAKIFNKGIYEND